MLPFFNERFVFFGRSKPLPYGKVEARESRSEAELPLCQERTVSMFAKRTWQVCQRQTLDVRSLQFELSVRIPAIISRKKLAISPILCYTNRRKAVGICIIF